MSKLKLTPLLIVLVVGIIIAIPIAFYYLFIENGGGMALAGVLAGIYSLGMIVVLTIERILVNRTKISLGKVWIIEILLIALLLIAYAYPQPTYYLKPNDNVQWFGI